MQEDWNKLLVNRQRRRALGGFEVAEGDLALEVGAECVQGVCQWGLALEVGARVAEVAVLAQGHGDRHGTEEGDAGALGHELRAALAEDVVFFAVVGDEAGHVLDDAEDIDVELLEHA